MINKYKDAYNEVVSALAVLHNAHLTYLEGPSMRKSSAMKRAIKNANSKLKDLKEVIVSVNREVTKRERGHPIRVPNNPEDITPEFHEWVGKGLGRVNKYSPKTPRKKDETK
jgi:hypothetical protein